MGLALWKRKHILRRLVEPESSGGYVTEMTKDMVIKADVQTLSRRTTMGADGDYSVQEVKMFSDFEINVADQALGTMGDRLWFQGKWFECRSSRLSENTFLKHWTSTFVQCLNQEAPPDVEGLMK